MPIIKSAIKQLKQDRIRAKRNVVAKAVFKKALKDVEKLSHTGKKITVKTISKVYKHIDIAAKKQIIHPNKAARLKSRVSKLARQHK